MHELRRPLALSKLWIRSRRVRDEAHRAARVRRGRVLILVEDAEGGAPEETADRRQGVGDDGGVCRHHARPPPARGGAADDVGHVVAPCEDAGERVVREGRAARWHRLL